MVRADVFREVRERVPARSAAEHYGFQPNRAGFICCPFHSEKSASLKLYDNGSFHCFGCGAGGSSIDFTMKLFGLTPLEAVKRLDSDFNLRLGVDVPLTAEERAEAQKRQQTRDTYEAFLEWKRATISLLEAVVRAANIALAQGRELTDAEAEAVRYQATASYYSDVLASGDTRDQMEIFRERREVTEHCQAILKSLSPMKRKSGAA